MSESSKPKRIRISPEQARAMYDEEEATILDVVDTHVYEKVPDQIEGAVRIDPEMVADEFERLPEGRSVLTYCT